MHKKTYTTEFAALFTVAFAIYQGHKSGVINPDLIGQMFIHSYDVAAIILSAGFALGRKIYTKYFRKPKDLGAPSGPIHYYDFTKPMDSKEIEQIWLKNKGANIIATDREAMKNDIDK